MVSGFVAIVFLGLVMVYFIDRYEETKNNDAINYAATGVDSGN